LEEETEEVRIRDGTVVTLTETGPHTGIFAGTAKPVVVNDASQIRQGDDVLSAMRGDTILLEYTDDRHIGGTEPRLVKVEAKLLVGAIQDVKIEHREVESLEIKARKDLIEPGYSSSWLRSSRKSDWMRMPTKRPMKAWNGRKM